MEGWIKIHRLFNDWEWRDSPKHVSVFLDLLVNANHKKKRYRGVIIEAGQLTTSYQAIADRTGLTVRKVRTVLKDLETTHETTHQGFRHFSLISITNWSKYQVNDTRNDIVTTTRRQPSDNLTTTNKNEKNVKNVKKGKGKPSTSIFDALQNKLDEDEENWLLGKNCKMNGAPLGIQEKWVKNYGVEAVVNQIEKAYMWVISNPDKPRKNVAGLMNTFFKDFKTSNQEKRLDSSLRNILEG